MTDASYIPSCNVTTPRCHKRKTVQKDDAKRLRPITADSEGHLVESSPSNKHVKDASTNSNTGTVEGYSIKNSTATTVEPCGHHRSGNNAVTEDTGACMKKQNISRLLEEKRELQDVIDQWQEKLRRLNLVKSHKGDLPKLQQLTTRWQQVSQQVLLQLQERAHADQRPTLGQLMDHMGIDENMLELDREQDCFN